MRSNCTIVAAATSLAIVSISAFAKFSAKPHRISQRRDGRDILSSWPDPAALTEVSMPSKE